MTKIGRNALCPCGSGFKYKRCCEGKDLAAALKETAQPHYGEMVLAESVYQSILAGVWLAFNSENKNLPNSEELEDFYREIYGYDLDPELVEEIVFPLSPLARARLPGRPPQTNDKIIDLDPMPEVPPSPLAQADLFLPPEGDKDQRSA